MSSWDWNGEGKTVIVTGPTGSGIGFECSKWLAERGAHVILAGRSKSKLESCEALIRQTAKKSDGSAANGETLRLTSLELDLTSFESIEAFVQRFNQLNLPCHILLNNAGVMATTYGQTQDGFELQFGTNHVGHFYLTQLLLPKLRESTPARIVNVASLAHKMATMHRDRLNECFHPTSKQYGAWTAYGNSKLANILHARSLQERYSGEGITSYSLHPGAVATELGRNGLVTRAVYGVGSMLNLMKTSRIGAATSIYCATHPDALKDAGKYFDRCVVATNHTWKTTNDELAQALWNQTEKEVQLAIDKRSQQKKERTPEGEASTEKQVDKKEEQAAASSL